MMTAQELYWGLESLKQSILRMPDPEDFTTEMIEQRLSEFLVHVHESQREAVRVFWGRRFCQTILDGHEPSEEFSYGLQRLIDAYIGWGPDGCSYSRVPDQFPPAMIDLLLLEPDATFLNTGCQRCLLPLPTNGVEGECFYDECPVCGGDVTDQLDTYRDLAGLPI